MLRSRLARAIAPLSLGTAVAITAFNGDAQATVVTGNLWDSGPAADAETRFNVASVSKLLTAARIVSLAKRGAIGLEDPISKHLPGVRLVDAAGVDHAGQVTIRDLLRHRSGLPMQPADLLAKVNGRWDDPNVLRKLTESWEVKLTGTPGQYAYSNFGYALLGAIIERTGNCSFAGCMNGYLRELGMERSSFTPTSLGPNAAHGRMTIEGTASFHSPEWYGSFYALPFTGLWTSTPELARFGAALAAADADVDAPLHEMTVGTGHGAGPIHRTRLGAPSLEHDGSGPGFYAALVIIPSKRILVAIITNGGNESPAEAETFAQTVDAVVDTVGQPLTSDAVGRRP